MPPAGRSLITVHTHSASTPGEGRMRRRRGHQMPQRKKPCQ